jgi:hypothetical protein
MIGVEMCAFVFPQPKVKALAIKKEEKEPKVKAIAIKKKEKLPKKVAEEESKEEEDVDMEDEDVNIAPPKYACAMYVCIPNYLDTDVRMDERLYA